MDDSMSKRVNYLQESGDSSVEWKDSLKESIDSAVESDDFTQESSVSTEE